jgi:hypothetical protein
MVSVFFMAWPFYRQSTKAVPTAHEGQIPSHLGRFGQIRQFIHKISVGVGLVGTGGRIYLRQPICLSLCLSQKNRGFAAPILSDRVETVAHTQPAADLNMGLETAACAELQVA